MNGFFDLSFSFSGLGDDWIPRLVSLISPFFSGDDWIPWPVSCVFISFNVDAVVFGVSWNCR